MAIASVHWVGAGSKGLTLPASVGGVSRGLAVHHIGRDREYALRVCRVSVGRVFAYLFHEAGDEARCYLIDPVIIVAELGCRYITDVLIVDDQSSLVAHGACAASGFQRGP